MVLISTLPTEADKFCSILKTAQDKSHGKTTTPPPPSESTPSPPVNLGPRDVSQKTPQAEAIRLLAKYYKSPTDTWDGKAWSQEPIGRYKVVFETWVTSTSNITLAS